MIPDNAKKLSELFTELLSPYVDGLSQGNIKPEVFTGFLQSASLIRSMTGFYCSDYSCTKLSFEEIEIPPEVMQKLSEALGEKTNTWIVIDSGCLRYYGSPGKLEVGVENAKSVIQHSLSCALQ